ncbi:piggyBac transposable element-derived protein 4-like [Anastrepha obliqua]|uniref:piggyBac transposable element-derived protein 4-like n=1 Tax=Anastrepha obliqua TaxID=95512 RepID=UPI002409EF3B|nr:piggyBac transposable element-derived protein 4-like [Anastrepha obliqua]
MSGSKIYTDEEIEKFLAMCDDENGLDDELDNSELESDAEIEQNESLGDASSSEESTDTDEDNIPLHLLRAKSNIIYFNKSILRGKNKHKWSTKKGKSYRYGLNVVHKARGPTRHCKNITGPLQCFQMFITPEIVEEIVQWTNIEIANRQSILLVTTDEAQRKATTSNEMSALIGLLVLTAVKKDQHLSADELFDRSYGGTTYISIMTKARFKFLMSCLRFDDKSARLQIVEDNFAPIRKIWEMFIQKCRENYTPGEYLTIDEQLLAFRGKCSFRMYIPNKPAKYGLKMVMICDSGTNYMVDAMPYLGKGSNKTTFPLEKMDDLKMKSNGVHPYAL